MVESTSRRAWRYIGSGLLIWLGIMALVYTVTELVLNDHSIAVPVIGERSPDFELSNLAGERVRLSDQRGKPVILNFWATWCSPCVVEMPNIQKYYERYPGDFSVLAVNADEPELTVKRFVEDMGLSFDILLDPGGDVQSLYQIRGYPTSYFVDGEGVIRVQHIGFLTEDQLADYLSQVGVGP
jgi:peroxiredoxin